MVKIVGAKKHNARLKRATAAVPGKVLRALYAAGQAIEIEAEISITAGSISGKNHVPSNPGEPPNADTRLLDTSIETTIERRGNNPAVHVTSNAPYSAFLEYGTSRMEERPFMRPAARKKRGLVSKYIRVAVVSTYAGPAGGADPFATFMGAHLKKP